MPRPKLRLTLPLLLFSLVLVLPLWAGTLYYQASVDPVAPHTRPAPVASEASAATRPDADRKPLDLSTVYLHDRLR